MKFLPEGSLPPEEFFARINARWSHLEDSENASPKETTRLHSPKSAICIADYESIDQLTMDLAVMPGAGISNIEIVPIPDEIYTGHMLTELSAKRSDLTI